MSLMWKTGKVTMGYLQLLKFLLVCAIVIAALAATSAESANPQSGGFHAPHGQNPVPGVQLQNGSMLAGG
jgi:hypothetical protein